MQRRGLERRRAILEAAESLLAEQGYEAATLKAIGERAGIPTASMYHYFPDRHQVDAELLNQHVQELDARLTAATENLEPSTLREATDAVIDPILDHFRQHPSCVQLWFAGRNQTLDELVRTFDETQAERFWSRLVERGLISADTPQLVLQLAFETGSRLFDIAFRRCPTGDDTTIDEARRMLTAYLETYAPQQADRRG
ncbi:DNA-binding transcriptional regulator, AcrR family [Saccharopolyspora antimicrobica]|uniref:DNA-binding transcriptional regulator, AcrR family n=1 Tax=Saccharopolyspora antimicrobica TaxID=455193 RepID=A0A1I4VLJ6_9PSEU|nr:TetR family transcriptional regulator [Saccharopolyspora antimicrobica]SFN02101.1 DNA-binding transcriptional regulator, AcrR family [Saccharopolyspora antimicrobica]